MGMDIHESRRNHESRRIYDEVGALSEVLSDRGNPAVLDGEVAEESLPAGAVKDEAAADDGIEILIKSLKYLMTYIICSSNIFLTSS